jgi:hypothetical protein
MMKRDVDLCRQLLLDIEGRGSDCSVSVLRADAEHDVEHRVRYHLRLLVDAGYLKEIDRTPGGVPCVRLTDAGHELIELVRSESRWRDARQACHDRTGGLSLAVIRAILLDWALAPVRYRRRRFYSPAVETVAPRDFAPRDYAPRSAYRFDPYRDEWDYAPDHIRYVRLRPDQHNGWREVAAINAELAEAEPVAALPEFLI